jgi:DNA-binding helix-turn-helix protein
MMEESKLLKNIRNISKKKKIPLYVIEEKAGIAKGSISKWNDVIPSIEKVSKVAEVLGVTVNTLLK